jgi:hypothetical protein
MNVHILARSAIEIHAIFVRQRASTLARCVMSFYAMVVRENATHAMQQCAINAQRNRLMGSYA